MTDKNQASGDHDKEDGEMDVDYAQNQSSQQVNP